MAKRYGRNQRRAARERIAELEASLRVAERLAHSARSRQHLAVEDAFQRLAEQQDYIGECVKQIGFQLGRTLGPQLVPVAERVLASDRKADSSRSMRVDLTAYSLLDRPVPTTVIRGTIPEIHFNIQLRT